MKILSVIILALAFVSSSYAQEQKKLIQFSGVAVSADSLQPVAYAAVYDKSTGKGTIADYYGYFSFVTQPGDTLMFSRLGYKRSTYIIPDTLTDNRYSIIHVMKSDTLELPEVKVYPWPSREEFAQAFVNMNPYDDALRRAQRQLSGDNLAFAAARVPTDAGLSYNYAQEQYQTQLYTQGQTPVNNLLSPIAWAQFIDSWKKGELKRQ